MAEVEGTTVDACRVAESSAATIVRAVYRAFTSQESAVTESALRTLFADEIVIREPESLPWGGVYHGIESAVSMAAAIATPQSPIVATELKVERLFECEADDVGTAHVVAFTTFPWRGPKSTVSMCALEWFTVRDGKVREIQVFLWDTSAAVAALAV
jgi:ketosteroid isomerase-like protein